MYYYSLFVSCKFIFYRKFALYNLFISDHIKSTSYVRFCCVSLISGCICVMFMKTHDKVVSGFLFWISLAYSFSLNSRVSCSGSDIIGPYSSELFKNQCEAKGLQIIHKAYYKKSLKFHPDKSSDENLAENTHKFQTLSRIHKILSTKSSREVCFIFQSVERQTLQKAFLQQKCVLFI